MNQPEDKNPREGASPFEEALRNKQERKTAVSTDLEALEASLLAEIEAFDLSALTPGSQVPETAKPAVQATTPPVQKSVAPAAASPSTIQEEHQALAASPPPAATPAKPAPSLLEQLRQQAQARQQDESARKQDLEALSRQLDAALRRIFSYCHELVQQLNVLHPPVDRQYSMLGSLNFSGLEWKRGFVDYRTRPDGSGTLYELVTMSCHLAMPEQLRLEKDGLSADNFRKILFDNGIAFTHDEIRNAKHVVEKVIFTISAEVRVNLRWRADLERQAVMLECRNLERFGNLAYVIPLDAVKPAMLDEFGRLLLGQTNRFREHCGAPTALPQSR